MAWLGPTGREGGRLRGSPRGLGCALPLPTGLGFSPPPCLLPTPAFSQLASLSRNPLWCYSAWSGLAVRHKGGLEGWGGHSRPSRGTLCSGVGQPPRPCPPGGMLPLLQAVGREPSGVCGAPAKQEGSEGGRAATTHSFWGVPPSTATLWCQEPGLKEEGSLCPQPEGAAGRQGQGKALSGHGPLWTRSPVGVCLQLLCSLHPPLRASRAFRLGTPPMTAEVGRVHDWECLS